MSDYETFADETFECAFNKGQLSFLWQAAACSMYTYQMLQLPASGYVYFPPRKNIFCREIIIFFA